MELISVGHPTPKHKQFSVIHIYLCESIKKWQMVDIHIKKKNPYQFKISYRT